MIRRGVSLIFLALAMPLTVTRPNAQEPRFVSRVDAVRVDVLVSDRGRAVGGLGREDFEVRDNGVLQRVENVVSEGLPLSIMLALDTSESISVDQLANLVKATNAVLDGLTSTDKAGLIVFSSQVHLVSHPTPDVELLRRGLRKLQSGGDTALVDAAYAAMVLSEADAGRPLAVIFSDGADTSSFLRASHVLATARSADAVVYTIAAGRSREREFLDDLASQTGGRMLRSESPEELANTMRGILDEFRQRYLISFTPHGVSDTGWHRLDVRVKGRRATIDARRGYMAVR